MSKISLEPNASGAGTFTLAAPNSNTNRTLNLPDEEGTILSDASTIDSNNLQSDVYKQDNILGTVSESGGVPTGAIIERGSNANGAFIKYADGTMICNAIRTETIPSADDMFFNVEFPATFIDTTYAHAVIWTGGGVPGRGGAFTNVSSKTTSSANFRFQRFDYATLGGAGTSRTIPFMLIGRWY